MAIGDFDYTLNWIGDTHFDDPIDGNSPKWIHSVGAVGAVKFIPVENSEGYTGIFKGAQYGIIRFSTSLSYNTSKASPNGARGNFNPSIALKFLRNGVPSANILLVPTTNGR